MKSYLQKFKNFEPLKVLVAGDSTSSPYWCHPHWVDWLDLIFRGEDDWAGVQGRLIINSARDGAKIEYFLENFAFLISDFDPDVVILSLGINERFPSFDPIKTKTDLDSLFRKIAGVGMDLVAWSPHPLLNNKFSNEIKQIRDMYEELCDKYDAKFVDVHSEFEKYDLTKLFTFKLTFDNVIAKMKPSEIDYLHCNTVGHQIIADKIAKEAFDLELYDWDGYGTMNLVDLEKYKK
ncbi:hypothetical protein A2886_03525 [candidate division WWE3 bacterium RIFCSPHIGHO2_01_FULL_42_13]|uniref:SGNH hydrolase-type esterase domain-containing protein n=1 Tax=candidate division WWE3 bacterium RIFCSPHIGHO2_01_FULL_42_13 TaxID=1802617 RepID=A0A1F4URC1_UNCKA|nr:MAG: hypothetical protein A2886_03525 [candidate division WWE3 bacterium RIFCSPHIGHO2_01_FULL_42_13]